MTDRIEIVGGAGPAEAAAIVAAISHVLELEQAALASPPIGNRPPAWVRAGLPRDSDDPLDVVVPDYRGDPT